MQSLPYLAIALGSYLAGSIPTGFLAGKLKGVDIRSTGSGNIGATNVFRILGKPAGIAVLLIDALKGFLACDLGVRLVAQLPFADLASIPGERLKIIAGICAVLGHNYTCWLRFKGGKGIATTAGVLIAWTPLAFLAVLGTWLAVFLASRYVSLASIAAAVALPFLVRWLHGPSPIVWITAGLSVLAIYRHKANIQRLLNGTENRFGSKKPAPPSPS